jgi:double zinc ribbon protein
MRCTKCGTQSSTSKKFCAECGSPLSSRSPKCAADNKPTSKFCEECGTALTANAASASLSSPLAAPTAPDIRVAPEQPAGAPLEGERKTVMALFADIKGSMDLIEDLDPEEARAIVDPALKLMMDAAHRYDGYIVQSTGDGIFGYRYGQAPCAPGPSDRRFPDRWGRSALYRRSAVGSAPPPLHRTDIQSA